MEAVELWSCHLLPERLGHQGHTLGIPTGSVGAPEPVAPSQNLSRTWFAHLHSGSGTALIATGSSYCSHKAC